MSRHYWKLRRPKHYHPASFSTWEVWVDGHLAGSIRDAGSHGWKAFGPDGQRLDVPESHSRDRAAARVAALFNHPDPTWTRPRKCEAAGCVSDATHFYTSSDRRAYTNDAFYCKKHYDEACDAEQRRQAARHRAAGLQALTLLEERAWKGVEDYAETIPYFKGLLLIREAIRHGTTDEIEELIRDMEEAEQT